MIVNVIKLVIGWFFRQGTVFILIVVAIAFHQLVWPKISNGEATTAVENEWQSAEKIAVDLEMFKKASVADFENFQSDLHRQTGEELQKLLDDKKGELAATKKIIADRSSFFPEIRPSAIIKTGMLNITNNKLSAEIEMLDLALTLSEQRSLKLQKIVFPTRQELKLSDARCKSANTDVRNFNKQIIRFESNADSLTTTAKTKCKNYVSDVKRYNAGLANYITTKNEIDKLSRITLDQKKNDLIKNLELFLSDKIIPIKSLFQSAFYVLVLIILMPFIIRIIFYYILAPIAARRASIHISVPNGGDVKIPLAQPSRVSVPITLEGNKELLVRQNYLQTSSLVGKKETRWMLDYTHIFSSVASGLIFLTRIRGEGEITTVSAVRDPFAELTEVFLPEGAACVLHPRALVAVVYPSGKTMKITSHWRLFTLSAWLTMQLRYLVFHGPGRLIVKGGRGIRVEQAERGRIFGQDQLVGFSADLSYSVIRAETFAPYFFGREQLYKDKVEQGSGILIIEEAPQASREGSGARRGLEGIFDAGMKAFGL